MNGKTVVITGGTSGIGEVAALSLAAKGARILFVARDAARAEATLAKLKAAGPAAHGYFLADLSSLAAIKHLASEIRAAEEHIDVLINNAGAYFDTRQVTVDGLERTFALNHMAYFVLTTGLFLSLKPGSRIVSTASEAHRFGKIDFHDLQSSKNYKGFAVYGATKLMNILFTRELARKLAGSGITAVCLHPGFVNSRFSDNNESWRGKLFNILKRAVAITPEAGARTIVHLASSPEVESAPGTYWYKCRIVSPRKSAQSDANAARLWALSEEIANG